MDIDLNRCKRGDRLISRDGQIFTYDRKSMCYNTYIHIVKYFNREIYDTRTDGGRWFVTTLGEHDLDIVYIFNDDLGVEWEDI